MSNSWPQCQFSVDNVVTTDSAHALYACHSCVRPRATQDILHSLLHSLLPLSLPSSLVASPCSCRSHTFSEAAS